MAASCAVPVCDPHIPLKPAMKRSRPRALSMCQSSFLNDGSTDTGPGSPPNLGGLSPASRASLSSEDMLTGLDPGLICGVSLRACLSGLGRHWRRERTSLGSSTSSDGYHFSRPARQDDFFFCHDWGTSGWLKFLSLFVLFNSRAATLASVVYSFIASAAVLLDVVQTSFWLASARLCRLPCGAGLLAAHAMPRRCIAYCLLRHSLHSAK